jgi:hypothetical protein
VTIARNAPLLGTGWRHQITNSENPQAFYFLPPGWTAPIALKRFAKTVPVRIRIWPQTTLFARHRSARSIRRADARIQISGREPKWLCGNRQRRWRPATQDATRRPWCRSPTAQCDPSRRADHHGWQSATSNSRNVALGLTTYVNCPSVRGELPASAFSRWDAKQPYNRK